MDNTDPLIEQAVTRSASDQDPLSQLADIHLPAEVGLWPLAPGWWVLLALLAAGGVWLALILVRRWRQRRRLAFALAELEQCFSRFGEAVSSNTDSETGQLKSRLVNDVNQVLRRVALIRFPGEAVASLSGSQWVDFLASHAKDTGLTDEIRHALAQGRFAPRCEVDTEALHAMARSWITQSYLTRIEGRNSHSTMATGHA